MKFKKPTQLSQNEVVIIMHDTYLKGEYHFDENFYILNAKKIDRIFKNRTITLYAVQRKEK